MSVVTEALKARRDEWAECIREATQMPGLIEAIKAAQEAAGEDDPGRYAGHDWA